MESRMEKYYKEDLSSYKRTKRNEKLYRDISSEISNLDNLPIPDNSNEIDINGLKEIISSRDEYRKNKQIDRTTILERKTIIEGSSPNENRRIYDINVLLENAKNEINKNAEVNKEEDKIINTNFLTSLEDANIPYIEDLDDTEDLSEPVSNIDKKASSTNSLPLDILVDLKGDDNTEVTDPIVKEEVTMIKKIKEGETFYSGSFNFTKKDFDEEDDEKLFEEKSHTGIKVFFLILGLLLLVVAMYFIITKYVI